MKEWTELVYVTPADKKKKGGCTFGFSFMKHFLTVTSDLQEKGTLWKN